MTFPLELKPTLEEETHAWNGKSGCRTGHRP